MWFVEDNFIIKLGGSTFINVPNLIIYKGESLFRIVRSDTDGLLGIEFDIFDSTGNRVATVRRGNIVQGDKEKYAIDTEHDHYTITDKSNGIKICDIKKRQNAKDVELEVSVHMYTKDGYLFEATPSYIVTPNGNVFSGSKIENCTNGMTIG